VRGDGEGADLGVPLEEVGAALRIFRPETPRDARGAPPARNPLRPGGSTGRGLPASVAGGMVRPRGAGAGQRPLPLSPLLT
jgi:hypothetical protein